ncbi:acyl-CoA thioester hydrolase [Marinospirillum celere]|uniref:Acyl-CoA thioester hydrolase n=1 Tax=Marinospirillum celere TaxID=1122252 RepID=A0A1I1H734_9GAMM|nr:thioesterase family protein [Marinospirillum celere]SFC17868.1 acyl-CoA thioester hydrolase [Marinospirillum celere]
MNWDLPDPFVIELKIPAEAIDHYGHVNNAEYLRFIEKVSWQHSQQLGLSLDDYRALDRAMVVVRHELDYQAPAYEGDELEMATWIVDCDQRNSLVRRFQLQRCSDKKTLFRGKTYFACVALSSHRPRRLPEKFLQVYLPALIEEMPSHS